MANRSPLTPPLILFSQPDFRRAYLANAVSQLGNAFQFVALMWFAVVAAGPFGVIVVRLVDALPALLFGLHGGLAADRWDRRRVMIAADLVRGLVLVPIAVVALVGTLALWAPDVMFLAGGIVLFALALTAAGFVRVAAVGAGSPGAAV